MKHAQCYLKNYPRPQFVRRDWIDLNGQWSFRFDDENAGETQQWFLGLKADREITVPYSYQTKASGIQVAEAHENIWYERVLRFDRPASKRLCLNFEGSDYRTKVWVNGIFIGMHEGGYTRFSFDITDAVGKDHAHTRIVIKCEDTYDATQPRGKQKWLDQPFGCWYTETNGIWKSLWAECVDPVSLKELKITPNIDTYCADFEVELSAACADLCLETQIFWEGKLVAGNVVAVLRDKFSFSLDLSCDREPFKAHWWSYDNPALYDIKLVLKSGDNVLDEVGSYLGFRAFYANKDALILNNGPTYLKMVLEQGYSRDTGLTFRDEDSILQELQLIKELGFNGVRVHQKIEDERFFYYADILGLATWVEMPSAYEFRDATVEKLTAEWLKVVRQYYNQPSVFAWVPINESWGVPRIMTNKREQWFTECLYYLTKSFDTIRPVISNDGWEHTTSDIITLHNYGQSPAKLEAFYADLTNVLGCNNINNFTQGRLAFANGYEYAQQPIMITEFAGIGFETNGDKGWGYGDQVKSEQQFYERLKGLVKSISKNNRISGFCITQITDVESEVNGILDADRKPKIQKQLLVEAINQ